jgi:energy-coupling factor transport system ATP-binding protein
VECRDLCFSHGKRVILQGLDLEIRGRECVTMVGENGAGKTTLCEILAGLRPPCRGHVRVDGRDVFGMKPDARIATVGLVVQNPDRQLFAPQVQGELPCGEGSRLLRRFGLWSLRDRHPKSLSYGQKRRLAMARILARNPRFLMVDEVSVGQDQSSLQVLLEELWSYVCAGGSLLVTSHDPRVVGRLPGRVVELAHGGLRDCPGRLPDIGGEE